MQDPLAGPEAFPCEKCPIQHLDEYLASPDGQLMSVVFDLDFALQSGMPVSLNQILFPEFLLLRQLADERAKYQIEEMKNRASQAQNGSQPNLPPGRF
jgi:hypothetical protein